MEKDSYENYHSMQRLSGTAYSITQNAIQLLRQKKVFEKQMEGVEDITNFDIYRHLGNRVNHDLTERFIASGYDLNLLEVT